MPPPALALRGGGHEGLAGGAHAGGEGPGQVHEGMQEGRHLETGASG